jgi:uncharacterized membrane protein
VPFRQDLERWAQHWVDSEIISEEQRVRILDLDYAERGLGQRLAPIFALLGAGLVFLGLALVISQNWDEIGKLTKLSGGILLLIAFSGAGYWVRFGPMGLRKTGEGLMLVGTGAFLGNLALISQQYNIDFNPSPLLAPVLLSAIAMAYLLTSRAYAFVAAGLLTAWLIFESQRGGSSLQSEDDTIFLLVMGIGGWLLAVAALNRRTRYERLAAPLELAGGLLLFVAVYFLGFLRYFDVEIAVPGLPAGVLLLTPIALVAAASLVVGAQAEERLGWPAIPDGLRPALLASEGTLLLLLVWTLIVSINPRGRAEEEFILYTVGYWVGALLLTASVVWLGLALRREFWINAALAFLGLFILTRYFDLFSNYAQTGALFAGAGLLFLGLALALERGRRVLSASIDDGPTSTAVGEG